MTIPPDHIQFDLVPNDDSDPEREAAATKAVEAAIAEIANAHGFKVHNKPGAIEPDARENVQRARKIESQVTPKLVDATAKFHREVSIEEEYDDTGSRRRRKIHRITKARVELGSSLGELQGLLDKCFGGVSATIEIAVKVVTWVHEKIPSRKR